MRIQILRDPKGKVIGAVEPTPGDLVSIEADVGEGEELVEVELPDEYMRIPAPEFIKRLQADIEAERLEIVSKTQ